jgi:polysaccharide deacetylase family protein (PEP-CTERM system associated)
VRDIVAGGHELASHGYGHERASDLDRGLPQDMTRAPRAAGRPGGRRCKGYRAPSFSIGRATCGRFDTLARTGYRYSSSIYPIAHDHYGMPDAPRFAYRVRAGLLEVPVTTLRMVNRNLPSSGGGYFRLLPYGVTRWMLQASTASTASRRSSTSTPGRSIRTSRASPASTCKTRFRHYVNIDRNEGKLRRLLADFRWGRMDDIFLDGGRCAPRHASAPDCGVIRVPSIQRLAPRRRRRRAGTPSSWPARRPPSSTAPAGSACCATSSATTPLPEGRAGGRIVGVLPLAHVKSCCSAARWWACPLPCMAAWPPTTMRPPRRWSRGAALARELGVQHLELRNLERAPRRLAAAGPVRHLPQGHPARRRGQHAGHPAQAARDGAQGHQERPGREIDDGVDRFFALYADNVHRHGTPAMPKRYFEALRGVRRRLRGADRHRPRRPPLSSVMSFYFRDEVLPYYAGDDEPRATWPPTTSSTGS